MFLPHVTLQRARAWPASVALVLMCPHWMSEGETKPTVEGEFHYIQLKIMEREQ